jgi:hypothetical protein
MASTVAWLDDSEHERRKMLDVIALIAESVSVAARETKSGKACSRNDRHSLHGQPRFQR